MSDTYYENKYGHWFVFGKSTDGKLVDIADANGDVITRVDAVEAERAIEQHNEMIDQLDQYYQRIQDHIDRATNV